MTVRIISEADVRDALAANDAANVDRQEALDEIENLRGFIEKTKGVIAVDHDADPFFDPVYALELLDIVKTNIESGWHPTPSRQELFT